jgi:hypothetical protein
MRLIDYEKCWKEYRGIMETVNNDFLVWMALTDEQRQDAITMLGRMKEIERKHTTEERRTPEKIVGRKYRVVRNADPYNPNVEVGDVITLLRDDGSNSPFFHVARTAEEWYVGLNKLELLPEEPKVSLWKCEHCKLGPCVRRDGTGAPDDCPDENQGNRWRDVHGYKGPETDIREYHKPKWEPKDGEWVWCNEWQKPHQYGVDGCSIHDVEPLDGHLPILEYGGFKVGERVSCINNTYQYTIDEFLFPDGDDVWVIPSVDGRKVNNAHLKVFRHLPPEPEVSGMVRSDDCWSETFGPFKFDEAIEYLQKCKSRIEGGK